MELLIVSPITTLPEENQVDLKVAQEVIVIISLKNLTPYPLSVELNNYSS